MVFAHFRALAGLAILAGQPACPAAGGWLNSGCGSPTDRLDVASVLAMYLTDSLFVNWLAAIGLLAVP